MNSETADREMVCIVCPVGCRLKIKLGGEKPLVSGNRCPRGEEYAIEELLAPKRVVTATCGIRDREHLRLPVKTDTALPFEHIDDLLKEVYTLSVETPVKRGDVLIKNFRGTGVQLVASRSIG